MTTSEKLALDLIAWCVEKQLSEWEPEIELVLQDGKWFVWLLEGSRGISWAIWHPSSPFKMPTLLWYSEAKTPQEAIDLIQEQWEAQQSSPGKRPSPFKQAVKAAKESK